MENQTESSGGRRRRIILFPLPFQGHINPMLQLANLFYSKGFSITILHTNFNAPATSNYPHFTFKSVLDNNPLDPRFSELPSQGIAAAMSRLTLFNQFGADSLRHELELLLLASDSDSDSDMTPKSSCLITDALWHFTQSVADSLNLPRLVLRTSSLFSAVIYASIPLLDDRGYFKLDHTHLEEQVEEFSVLKVKDILKTGFKSKEDSMVGLSANMLKQTKASSGIIWNSFKELEEPELETILRDFPIPSFLIPFPKHSPASSSSLLEQDRTFFPWLDNQPPNSVLYVSFGSMIQVDEKDFLEIAHGLVDSKQSFLWAVRPGFVKGSEWLELLPDGFLGEKGRVVKWAPQQEVLAHEAIGAFWTHNGWNSTLESICEGVPMICSPIWGDQPLNARYVSDALRVGVHLEYGWQREKIANAIIRVMVDEDIRERARVLKEKLHVSLTKTGSSYQSLESLIDYISSI